MKKIISILLICAVVTGCSTRKNVESSDVEEPYVSAAESTSSSSVISSKKEPVSSVPESSSKKAVGSSEESSSVKEETSSASSTAVSSAASVPAAEEPTWTEQATNSVLYVNKEGIYSRKNAIVGSEAVKKYSLNDKVSVIAVTDTEYYKLEDGSFIHKDYLSDKETAVPKPVEVEQPVTPAETVSISSDAEKLLNSATLNPMKTNESDLDVLVEDVLGQITDSSMSTCQKVTAIYDYIVKTCSYGRPATAYDTDLNYHSDFDGLISSYAYTLLANKRGVCDDYSSLFVVLTRAIGLESYVVSGQVSAKSGGTTGHVWTIVKINGEYYVFDPQIEQSNTVNGQITYTYFCRPEPSVSGMYTYGVSDAMSMCLMFSDDEIQADNARDLAIALFGNFVVDEGKKSHHIGIAYY